MKKLTVSIGIPAYNEEANIKYLLKSLIVQKQKDFILRKIILISDGSTDNTAQEAKSLKEKVIKVVAFKKRIGLNAVQNKILKETNSDILILLNADVIPKNLFFLCEILKPLVKDENIGIVGADTVSMVPPRSFMEHVISVSHEFKKSVYTKINNSNNIYLCHGRARAFSKKFYKKLKWAEDYPEDAYSYLECIRKGFKFRFAPKAKVLFRSPSTLKDHLKQSRRFIYGKKKLEEHFEKRFVKYQFHIPFNILLFMFVKFLLKEPSSACIYILISIYARIYPRVTTASFSKIDVVSSSKRLMP